MSDDDFEKSLKSLRIFLVSPFMNNNQKRQMIQEGVKPEAFLTNRNVLSIPR